MSKTARALFLFGIIGWGTAGSSVAQVQKIHADVSGMTWAGCAAIMEIALRRLEGVDKITISLSDQTLEVSFKPEFRFSPQDIREAVALAEVKIVRFQVSAKGMAREQDGRLVLVAGKNTFQLVNTTGIISGRSYRVSGQLNESVLPLELNVSKSTLLERVSSNP